MVHEVQVKSYSLKNIKRGEVSGYSGYEIFFTIEDKLFNFMIAKTNPLMPLNILHRFKEQGDCPVCKKTIYAYPLGNQPCLELKKSDRLLLEKLKGYLPAK